MAHELDITLDPATGEAVAAFADSISRLNAEGVEVTDAWHRLGTPVGHKMTADEALDAAHMKGWNVRKIPLVAAIPDASAPVEGYTQEIEVPGKFVIVRDNPVNHEVQSLGVTGRWWTAYQNEATTKLLSDITDQSGAHIETIGALDGGRKTFVTMKMPDHMELRSPVDGTLDITDLYLNVFNNHDGQGALRAIISPVRVVCANTQRAAESLAVSEVAIRHTGDTDVKLEEVRRILGLTFRYQDTFAAEIERMAARSMDNVEVFDVIKDVFGVTSADTEAQVHSRLVTASKVMEVYRKDATVAAFAGSAYGGYNAVTRYLDHFAPVVGKGDEAAKRARRTLTSPGIGSVKSRAFELFSA